MWNKAFDVITAIFFSGASYAGYLGFKGFLNLYTENKYGIEMPTNKEMVICLLVSAGALAIWSFLALRFYESYRLKKKSDR